MKMTKHNHERFDFLLAFADQVFARYRQVGVFEQLTEPEQTLIRVWLLIGEVGNGGWWQFYAHSPGDFALETVSALKRITATRAAEIVESWNAYFPAATPSPNRSERIEQLDSLYNGAQEAAGKLEDEFYEEGDNIEECLYRYVIQNQEHFLKP